MVLRSCGVSGFVLGFLKWVEFRFEKLPDFCFICGCLDHEENDCDLELDIWLANKSSLLADGFRAVCFFISSSSMVLVVLSCRIEVA